MPKINSKIYIVLLIILVGLFIATLIFSSLGKHSTSPTENLTPTPVNLPQEVKPTPTIKLPNNNTGAVDISLPAPTLEFINQKDSLRNQLPIEQPQFTIDFDYVQDKFVVSLKEPQAQNLALFQNWLKTNYPLIPIDRFIVK